MVKGKIYFEGISRNGDKWRVIGDDSVQIIARNNGGNDERFFIVKIMTNVDKAIDTAKYFCER